MGIPIRQVDAFSEHPFAGNPAGVCLLSSAAEASWMRDVAREMNLSETAFVVPRNGGFDLRWFTPAVEVQLCGHATLATAHVLWEDGILAANETARFHTASGVLLARRLGEEIELDFPAKPERASPAPPGLARALGVEPVYVGNSAFDLLVLLPDEATVRRLAPDFGLLRQVPARGVIVTAPSSTPGIDFVSRFFGPAVGIDEDPVTGSAHCVLAPFWCGRLGRNELVGYQASARGGTVGVRLAGQRVMIAGRAVTVLRGEMLV